MSDDVDIRRSSTLTIERDGQLVTLIVRCPSVSEAKALFGRTCSMAQEGYVVLDVDTVPRPVIDG